MRVEGEGKGAGGGKQGSRSGCGESPESGEVGLDPFRDKWLGLAAWRSSKGLERPRPRGEARAYERPCVHVSVANGGLHAREAEDERALRSQELARRRCWTRGNGHKTRSRASCSLQCPGTHGGNGVLRVHQVVDERVRGV